MVCHNPVDIPNEGIDHVDVAGCVSYVALDGNDIVRPIPSFNLLSGKGRVAGGERHGNMHFDFSLIII